MSVAVEQIPAFFLHAPCTHHDHDQHWIRGGEGGNEVLLNTTDQRFFAHTGVKWLVKCRKRFWGQGKRSAPINCEDGVPTYDLT